MSVYLTKNMLSKLSKHGILNSLEDNKQPSPSKTNIFQDNKGSLNLVKDFLCRVCGNNGCTPLLDKLEGGYDIMSAIRTITNVHMSFDDSLPKYICTECLMSLQVALTFKKTCEETDKNFKTLLYPEGNKLTSYPYSKHDFTLLLHQMKVKRLKIEELQEKSRARREKYEIQLQKRESNSKGKQYKCSPCNLSFPTKDRLVQHRRNRQCMRRTCDICGQQVLSISQHRRTMHKEAAYHCQTCGKEFRMLGRLKAHMMVHTDTFNFFCDLCPYKCKHKYYLVMHMRTHTGEKPYKCYLCSATFVNASNLNKHKLTHQEKQFKCELCDKSFRTNPTLREHHEAAHMNIKHTCGFCGRDFCYRSDLRKHEIRSHNRTKREYVGGEPTYKQVERQQKDAKWPPPAPEPETIPSHTATEQNTAIYTAYTVNEGKQAYVYYCELPIVQQTPDQQQAVLNLPESVVKKDDAHAAFEPQQGMGLF